MSWSQILFVIENIIFWILVVIIAYWGRDAPGWTFVALFYYVIYLVIRYIFSYQGLDRYIYLNALNLFVILSLFAWWYRNY